MSHKSRAEQLAVKARKDPKKKAIKTKIHKPKNVYKRKRNVKEYYDEAIDSNTADTV